MKQKQEKEELVERRGFLGLWGKAAASAAVLVGATAGKAKASSPQAGRAETGGYSGKPEDRSKPVGRSEVDGPTNKKAK